jgi:hypothetical protein
MLKKRLMWVVWPAFLVAGLLEVVVFAMIDPADIHWFGQPLDLSPQAIYTIAFFVFWVASIVSSALTTLLAMSPFEINRCPIPKEERPLSCADQDTCGN